MREASGTRYRLMSGQPSDRGMQTILYHLTTLAVVAVIAVLGMGLWTMLRGSSPNLSQKLMRLRVLLQLVAIVIIMLFVFVARG